MQLSASGYTLLLSGVSLWLDLCVAGSRSMTFSTHAGTAVHVVRKVSGLTCSVCTVKGIDRNCSSSVNLLGGRSFTVEFTCSRPEDFFAVEITQVIDCANTSCKLDIGQKEPLFFLEFNRTFRWEVTVLPFQTFCLDFSAGGLSQVLPPVVCKAAQTYKIVSQQKKGNTVIGTFCPDGIISTISILHKGTVTLDVPGLKKLDQPLFSISVGPKIKTFAQVQVMFPSGLSSSTFFSPNYPTSFPDDQLMMWDFQIPPKHNSTVNFLNHTSPQCLQKEVMVEYRRESEFTVGKKLTDPQPAQRQGNFSLYLRNCEMDKMSSSPGLSLAFQVSVTPAKIKVVCTVDLRNEVGLSLHIKKKNPKSACKIGMNSILQDEVTLLSGRLSNLSLQDCPETELSVTVNKTIGCRQWKDCPGGRVSLTVPALPSCLWLPQTLGSLTWHLYTPEDGSLELLPSSGSLQQLLPPGDSCNGSYLLHVAEDDRTSIAYYCPVGSIRKIQVQGNVSVTAAPAGNGGLSQAFESFFDVSFLGEISENYIFSVSPQEGVPALLATPGWPGAMKAGTTVSWTVFVPPSDQADLIFLNISQPKCHSYHTDIKVQMLGSREEIFSRREDEEVESKLSVPKSFHLNVSNCHPDHGRFSILSQVVLQKTPGSFLSIIVGVVGALLLLALTALAVICVVTRKRKRQISHQVSIYNPNGNAFFPGHSLFPKSRADNESHVYATIDDTMVYGHLLQDLEYSGPGCCGELQKDTSQTLTGFHPKDSAFIKEMPLDAPEVDVYRPFVPLLPPPMRMRGGDDSHGPAVQSVVDNELHTLTKDKDVLEPECEETK